MNATERKALKAFSDDQLLEEIIRRRNATEREQPNCEWCDDCQNFVAWTGPLHKTVPDEYNPCSKGHKMSFHCPEDMGDDFGFYRRVCPDREAVHVQA